MKDSQSDRFQKKWATVLPIKIVGKATGESCAEWIGGKKSRYRNSGKDEECNLHTSNRDWFFPLLRGLLSNNYTEALTRFSGMYDQHEPTVWYSGLSRNGDLIVYLMILMGNMQFSYV